MVRVPKYEVALVLVSAEEGGRRSPLLPPCFRGVFALDGEFFSCYLFLDVPIEPGESGRASLCPLHPELLEGRLTTGVSFTLWERRTIATGCVRAGPVER